MLTASLAIIASYLAGSIPTALWVGRLVKRIDIREHGSGNMGATNVARVVGAKWGILVGLIDVAKGLLPVMFLSGLVAPGLGWNRPDAGLVLGVAAILGHLVPVFAGFRGGKGVLTALGVFLALLPVEAGIAVLVWGTVFGLTRIVSLGSLIASLAFISATLLRRYAFGIDHPTSLIAAAALTAVLVFFMHRSNIRRLLDGTESRFGRH